MDRTPLHIAVLKHDVDNVNYLLNNKANVNATDYFGYTPLLYAIWQSHMNIVKLLLEHGANVNALFSTNPYNYFQTPLHQAVQKPHAKIVKLLLEHGANVNALDTNYQTPLHHAVMALHADIISILLDHGANVCSVDCLNETPLHKAVKTPYVNIVKLLLDHGANVNALNVELETPLHKVTLFDVHIEGKHYVNIVKLLVEHGASVNAEDSFASTPLYNSIDRREPNISVLQTLIKYGANVNAVNGFGNCVLSRAVFNRTAPYEVLKLLLENGAVPKFDKKKNVLVDVAQPERYHIAELLIQYITLRKCISHGMFHVLDEFKTVLLWHIVEGSDCYNHFLKIAESRINEINNMKTNFICDEQTLFQFVRDNYSRATPHDRNIFSYVIDALLFQLKSGNYIACRDLIYIAIKRPVVVDRLCELKVLYQVSDSDTFTLNCDCIENLTKYFSKDDLINMIIVFRDHEFLNTRNSKRKTSKNRRKVQKKLSKM